MQPDTLEKILDAMLAQHRSQCVCMFQQCENAEEFREHFARADEVRKSINHVLTALPKEIAGKYRKKIQERMANAYETLFFSHPVQLMEVKSGGDHIS